MTTEENKRMLALSYIAADVKAENIELEQRVHQLTTDYNNVVRRLNGMEKHEPNTGVFTLGSLTEALNKCEALEKDNKELANEYSNLKQMYNELNEKYNEIENIKEDLRKQRDELEECINRFKSAEFVEMGQECQYKYKPLQEVKRKVGEGECCSCPHLMKADVFGKKCLLCAYLYDNEKEHDAHERY